MPIPISLPCLRASSLLAPQLVVADLLERQLERLLVFAGVVLEARGRLVRELVRRDEVLDADLGRVDVQLVRRVLDQALDQVGRLGDAERAAVGHAARRLVRVRAVGDDVRGGQVVRARHDVEQAGPELRRLRVGVERPVVGHHLHAQAEHLPVALQRQLAVHVVVAGEPGRDQVVGARLDPLHGLPDQERRGRRDHVAGVDRDLVAEPAAEVGGDDPDVLLRQPGHHREQRPVHVRRLRGHVDGRLAGRRHSRPPRSRKSPAGPGGSAGRTCRARPRRRRRQTPAPWPRRRPPPSGSSGCRSALPFRRGSPARPRPAPRSGPRPPAAGRSRRRCARARRAHVWVGGDHRRHLLPLETHLVRCEHRLGVAR